MSNRKKYPGIPLQQPQMRVDIASCPEYMCKCGCDNFLRAVKMRYLSPLKSPTGKEQVLQLDMLLCAGCGNQAVPANLTLKTQVTPATEPPSDTPQ